MAAKKHLCIGLSRDGSAYPCRMSTLVWVATLCIAFVGLASAAAQSPATKVRSLCLVSFGSTDHSRISTEGKACLDDVALNLQKFPDSSLALVGNGRASEKNREAAGAHRAIVVKRYLIREKGIDLTRLKLYTGSQDATIVALELIPADATLDLSGLTAIDESKLKK